MTCLTSYPHRGLPVLAYTTRRHLLLDLDNTSLPYARKIARRIMKQWSKVGHCLILFSSGGSHKVELIYNKWGRPLFQNRRDNYHLVFDNGIGYNLCCKICETLAGLGILNKDYVKIRKFRGDMTIRTSKTYLQNSVKPLPLAYGYVVNKHTKREDGYITQYLYFLGFAWRLFTSDLNADGRADDARDSGDTRAEVGSVYPKF